jgi:hypothetical protein
LLTSTNLQIDQDQVSESLLVATESIVLCIYQHRQPRRRVPQYPPGGAAVAQAADLSGVEYRPKPHSGAQVCLILSLVLAVALELDVSISSRVAVTRLSSDDVKSPQCRLGGRLTWRTLISSGFAWRTLTRFDIILRWPKTWGVFSLCPCVILLRPRDIKDLSDLNLLVSTLLNSHYSVQVR